LRINQTTRFCLAIFRCVHPESISMAFSKFLDK
jgi:hypothetical protein